MEEPIEQKTATASCTLEVSVVMPCLNEADTLARCIVKAQQAFCEHKIDGEVIVADNGSTDGSQAIATPLGASRACNCTWLCLCLDGRDCCGTGALHHHGRCR